MVFIEKQVFPLLECSPSDHLVIKLSAAAIDIHRYGCSTSASSTL